jgi:hypothetical protein
MITETLDIIIDWNIGMKDQCKLVIAKLAFQNVETKISILPPPYVLDQMLIAN